MVLHNIPAALFLFAPFFLYMREPGTHPFLSVFWAFLKGNNVQFFIFLIFLLSCFGDLTILNGCLIRIYTPYRWDFTWCHIPCSVFSHQIVIC